MEGERKRKRAAEKSQAGIGDRRTQEKEITATETEEDVAGPLPPPSEAEVEEFFAILRRMHVAVKYFGKSARSPPYATSDRCQLATPEIGVKPGENLVRNGGLELDLNSVPEMGSNNEP